MKKIFGTLFVAFILTVTAVSPAFAFDPPGPASGDNTSPAGPVGPAGAADSFGTFGPAGAAGGDGNCYYAEKKYNHGARFYRGSSRTTLVCQTDGSWIAVSG